MDVLNSSSFNRNRNHRRPLASCSKSIVNLVLIDQGQRWGDIVSKSVNEIA